MHEKRAHQDDPARADGARDPGALGHSPVDGFVVQLSGGMRARDNFERPVVRTAVVQVQADAEHRLHDPGRRMDVRDAILLRLPRGYLQ